jgi:hypothetical protein
MSMRNFKNLAILLTISALFAGLASWPAPVALARAGDVDLTSDGQSQLSKSLRYLDAGNWGKAAEASELAIAGAPDAGTCLAALARMDHYGAQANKARRALLAKALNLATTHEELEEVAFKARQAGCFDLSNQALDGLIGSTTTISKLYELAQKAQHAALPAVAHIAMEKAYKMVNNQPDALDYAKQAHVLGMDDLTRQAFKDLIDDEDNVVEMMNLLVPLGQYQLADLQRYLLKAALDKAKDTDEMLAVYNNAQKYNQPDIEKVALYRGRKMVLIKKVKSETDAKADVEQKKSDALPENMLKKPSGF